jgi:hypothetical protein
MKNILSIYLSLFLLTTTCFSIENNKKSSDDLLYGVLGFSSIFIFSKIEKELVNEIFSNFNVNWTDNLLSTLIGIALLNILGSSTESIMPNATLENKESSKKYAKKAATVASTLFITHLVIRWATKPTQK